jgi:hypothetical protein
VALSGTNSSSGDRAAPRHQPETALELYRRVVDAKPVREATGVSSNSLNDSPDAKRKPTLLPFCGPLHPPRTG